MSLLSPRVLALVWTLCIVVGLTLPGSALPSARLFEFDKLIHAGLFLVLALLWLSAFSRGRVDKGLAILAIILAFSVFTELYQGWLPFGRRADMLDAAADSVGATIGFIVWLPLRRRLETWAERSR
ncbi:MAG: VanZ family protein [Bacteroidetes bacterium]|nr:VanZ family protein [Bacteroidota bacterium]